MSIHGCCFDEGMAGHCGLECRCFLEGECTIVDEILEVNDDMEILENGDHNDYLLKKYLGEVGFQVFCQQTDKKIDIYDFLKKRIEQNKTP